MQEKHIELARLIILKVDLKVHPDILFSAFLSRIIYMSFNKCWMNAYSSDASVIFSAKAIDEYASLRSKAVESNEMVDIDPRLEAIVERMLGKYGILMHLMLLSS